MKHMISIIKKIIIKKIFREEKNVKKNALRRRNRRKNIRSSTTESSEVIKLKSFYSEEIKTIESAHSKEINALKDEIESLKSEHAEKMEALRVAKDEEIIRLAEHKAECPVIDAPTLTVQAEASAMILQTQNSELQKFIKQAKEQGIKMPFEKMEMGVLAAGRRDMENGLTEILNSLEFNKPTCSECDGGMNNRGRSKKKY